MSLLIANETLDPFPHVLTVSFVDDLFFGEDVEQHDETAGPKRDNIIPNKCHEFHIAYFKPPANNKTYIWVIGSKVELWVVMSYQSTIKSYHH